METTLLSRHKQEEIAMIIIYQCLAYDDKNIEYDIKEIISDNLQKPFEESDLFIRRLVVSALSHKDEIINAISNNLQRWSYKRLDYITKAILMLSYIRFYYVEKCEKKIIINTAVKLSKKYSDAKAYRLVNALLESILND